MFITLKLRSKDRICIKNEQVHFISPKDKPASCGPDYNDNEHTVSHVVAAQATRLMKFVTSELEERVQHGEKDKKGSKREKDPRNDSKKHSRSFQMILYLGQLTPRIPSSTLLT